MDEVKPVDLSLVAMATDSVQAQERLHLSLRRHAQQDDHIKKLRDESGEALDKLRDIKSRLEGSHLDFEPTTVNHHDNLHLELKQLTLMHVPASLTTAVREKFTSLIEKLFKDQCKRLLCGVLLTCPWYGASQRERGEQARHNVLFIVYVSHDDKFLSPANTHLRDQSDVIDMGWLYAIELYHLVHCLAKGKSRFAEALFCHQGAVLFEDEDWKSLREMLDHKQLMGLRGFVEQCRGQAIGGIAKKRKTGKMGLRGTVTIEDFSESFRLLNNLHNLLKGQRPCSCDLELNQENLPPQGHQAVDKLRSLYKNPDVSKQEIFDLVISWRDQLSLDLKGFNFTPQQHVEGILGKWMAKVRVKGQALTPFPGVSEEEQRSLVSMMESIGDHISKLDPSQILMIARAGSHLYGLSTPDSDVDYVVIYRAHTQTILSSCKRLTEIHESRGPEKAFEYGVYEARMFCEMLLKCSVVILELLFVDSVDYVSEEWKVLSAKRHQFVTEKAIQQYLGLIKNNFNMIRAEKFAGTSRDRKLFYQIFHKLGGVEQMLEGKTPSVRCQEDRDFIMRVRKDELQGEMSRENLLQLATDKYEKLRDKLANRKTRLPECPDYKLVTDWLTSIRGW
ncbi:uncharacterized protein LOC135463097 [Liolophura sinensis]|uniref:uncharacterized protein LOC135463097 n=1 Tax=Liolophura sinensis TaxID=3198878 RepID=UPI003157F44D